VTGVTGRVKRALDSVGAYRAALASRPYAGVAVLAYHGVRNDGTPMRFGELHITVERLASHCRVLRKLDCHALGLSDWEDVVSHRRPLPPRGVMLTFDDGYRTLLTHALPVLEQYEIPATVFVCTDPVERQVRFWFDALAERDGEEAVEEAKALPYPQWLELIAKSDMPVAADDLHAPLPVPDLQRLARHRLISVGAHTARHPILAHADAAAQHDEIMRSRRSLEAWLQREVTAFAYPNGRPGTDFNRTTVEVVAQCGLRQAFAIGSTFADPFGPGHEHPRFLMLDAVADFELAHRLAGAWTRVPVP
jgi:peptidoglycan/xylan/chitin deacetylase (PgdA/CDA1 family)